MAGAAPGLCLRGAAFPRGTGTGTGTGQPPVPSSGRALPAARPGAGGRTRPSPARPPIRASALWLPSPAGPGRAPEPLTRWPHRGRPTGLSRSALKGRAASWQSLKAKFTAGGVCQQLAARSHARQPETPSRDPAPGGQASRRPAGHCPPRVTVPCLGLCCHSMTMATAPGGAPCAPLPFLPGGAARGRELFLVPLFPLPRP